MLKSAFAKLGRKLNTPTTFKRLRKTLDKRISRMEVAHFKTEYPEEFERLHSLMTKQHIKEGRAYVGGKLNAQHLFDFLYPDHDNTCPTCSKLVGWAEDRKTYREYCSNNCVNLSTDIVKRRKKTGLDRYGMEPNLHPSIAKKRIRAWERNYGVTNPSKSEEIQNRKRATCLYRYGVTHHSKAGLCTFSYDNPMKTEEGRANHRASSIERWGVPFPMQHRKVKKKLAQTFEDRYGTNPGAIPNGYRRKTIQDRKGRKHVVQGYEPRAIEFLDRQRTVTNIVSSYKAIPKIRYRDSNRSIHTYRPDLLVTKASGSQHLIEVKGSWPLRKCFDTVVRKAKAATRYAKAHDMTYWVFYYRDNGDLVKLRNPTTEKAFHRLLKPSSQGQG